MNVVMKLDPSRLLGFRLDARSGALGAKAGAKPGGKIGGMAGRKNAPSIGAKAGRKG